MALVAVAATSLTAGVFELVQSRHRAAATAPDGTCELAWWRSALGAARYRITCEARGQLDLSKLKLLSGPAGVDLAESVEDLGPAPWEDQRPMAGELITVAPGRTWVYDGTISLGLVPFLGPRAAVTLSMMADDSPLMLVAEE